MITSAWLQHLVGLSRVTQVIICGEHAERPTRCGSQASREAGARRCLRAPRRSYRRSSENHLRPSVGAVAVFLLMARSAQVLEVMGKGTPVVSGHRYGNRHRVVAVHESGEMTNDVTRKVAWRGFSSGKQPRPGNARAYSPAVAAFAENVSVTSTETSFNGTLTLKSAGRA